MEPFKFVHTADLHLDTPFGGISEVDERIAARLRDATLQAFDNIVELCLQEKVNFLLVAGDVYDARDRSLRAQLRFRDGLARLSQAGVSTFVVHGNHDPLNSRIATIQWPKDVYVFGGEGVSRASVRQGDNVIADIYGMSYPTQDVRQNLARDFHREASSPFAIGLLHCNVGQDTGHEPYAPCSLDDLIGAGMDYWALGHVHAHKVLSPEKPTVLYPGNPQGRHPAEAGLRGCYLVEVNATGGCSARFMPVDAVRWSDETVDIAGLGNDEAIISAARELCNSVREASQGRPAICRLNFTGAGTAHYSLNRPAFLADLVEQLRQAECAADPFVWVERIEARTRGPVDIEALRLGQDFVGEFLRIAADSRNQPETVSRIRSEISRLFESRLGRLFLQPLSDEELQRCLDQAESQCLDLILEEQD